MDVVGERDEDKMDSISNRVKEPSTFTKLTSKSQIEDLKAQLEQEKAAPGWFPIFFPGERGKEKKKGGKQ